MRFWTIQPRSVCDQMASGGSVRVDPGHPKYGGKRPWQYEWLGAGLLRHRPGFDGGWPWWLSCDKPDIDRLRFAKLPGGTEQARLELELPGDRCTSFPLWMWETIHTGNYLAFTRKEFDDWQRELTSVVTPPDTDRLPEPWQTRLESSWERIFERGVPARFWYRDEEIPGLPSGLDSLMRDASEELAGLTQVLRAADCVEITAFDVAE